MHTTGGGVNIVYTVGKQIRSFPMSCSFSLFVYGIPHRPLLPSSPDQILANVDGVVLYQAEHAPKSSPNYPHKISHTNALSVRSDYIPYLSTFPDVLIYLILYLITNIH